jgi:DNA-binding transcriptional LysR family regulator
MKLSLDALLVIDAIARRGSFAAAAQELHRVPSAVTYAVQKLEEDLGVLIFDRSRHRARLTPAGRKLLEEGRHLLRAAGELEARVQRVATGWEAELRIAYDAIIPAAPILELAEDFYRQDCGTRLRLSAEVLGGCWDALASGRADLVIGAPGDGPWGGGYSIQPMGEVEWLFAVAPAHPLALVPEPVPIQEILGHRAVTMADTSRNLPPRTVGLIQGQETLTVADMPSKVAAQCMGMGVGNLPASIARRLEAEGRLVVRTTEEPKERSRLSLVWHTTHRGNALAWFLERLKAPDWLALAMARG